MANEQIIISGFTPEQFKQMISDLVEKRVTHAIKTIKTEELQERFLSIAEVQKMFVPAISRKTVSNWTGDGILKKHVIAGKPCYKYSEVIAAVKAVKKYKASSNI